MTISYKFGLVAMLAGIAPFAAFAHSYGPPPRVTGGAGDNSRACTVCHTGGAINSGTGSVKIVLQGAAVYIPGVKQRITVHVADPTQQRWGFELSARLNSDLEKGQAGDFTPVNNFTQVICEDNSARPCLTGVTFVTHTAAGTRNGTRNGASFDFDWMPPATNAGPITFFVAGNAANGNGQMTGDLIYTSSLQLNPVAASAPAVSAANVVNSATNLAGPVTANSWVTIYGTNLSPTTRAWGEGDFVEGGIPFSLDGVSVLLSQFGAPRLAYVGYVSPTQVNVLIPSDLFITTTTLQLKNPAGITTAVPITVAANAPQLFSPDGKAALGTHQNGSLVTKAAPALPGEIISLYGTGLGATTPALIVGLVPTQASPLATTPQVSIGGAPATVSFAGVVPGAAGVYQINVQVPSAAANGDLPVGVQVGTTNAASLTVSVQK